MVLFALPSLETLFLSSNELYGTLDDMPDPLSSFLYFIDLSSNSFTGHIPKSLFDLTGLEALWLDSNHFTGTVELSILWKLKTLDSLCLSNNLLSVIDVEGDYPFPYLHAVSQLRLASCNLTKFPVALKYANKMSDLDLSNNQIDGAIPSWIWVNWKHTISSLNLSNNMLTSLENSPSVIHVNNLYYLDLSSNKLHGSVPLLLTSTKWGVLLDYSKNRFSSIIPDFGRYLPNNIYNLNLSRNKLHGHIPRSICTQQYLAILDLSYNNFGGRVPSCLTQGSSLIMLKLRDNHFHGVLPDIGEKCMLQTIDLNSNRIEGILPRSLSNCRSLEVLDIGRNQIIDYFPSWLGDMSNLRILILRSNQFYGSIGGLTDSDAISKHFSGLQIIDLASNNFSGSLNSMWFHKLEAMMANSSGEGTPLTLDPFVEYYYQEILTFKGIDLTFTKILNTFKMIDLSNNAFDGHIPESIGNLIALHGLNMSHNAFSGGIPSMLGDLAQLESLDLCRNKLSGAIPQELTMLTYLAVLNLSYNDFNGMIPQGPQFSLFTNSSFQGNEGLCGRPLSKQCNSSGTGTLSSTVSSKDSVGTIVLFVFVGSGFGVGFAVAVVLSVVWQAKRWNCIYLLFLL
jgi:Leucine-rich repeat (LRR) protein